MDKQKQIEEMIGIIQGAVGGCATHWASLIAEEVLKYYQPKIPENAVVLTGTETEERLEDLLIDFDEMSFYPATTCPNPDEYAREWKRKLMYVIGRLKKEIAEKFAERAKEKCKELQDKYSHICKSKYEMIQETCRYEGVTAVKNSIDEIAKEFTGVKK